MKPYLASLDSGNQRGNLIPLLLEDGPFPITHECAVRFNGEIFHIAEYFRDVPEAHKPRGGDGEGITEHVHSLISHADSNKIVIAIRLIHSPAIAKYLFLDELSPGGEINFGYLIFRTLKEDIHIRDYDPGQSLDTLRERDYGEDLTPLVFDTLARIGRGVYGKGRLINTYTYPHEKDRFLKNGFREVDEPESGGKLWVREI